MKKTIYTFLAAALAFAGAACTMDELTPETVGQREIRTFVCSFDGDAQTRTDITKQGKTVWVTGDKIWVSNGTEADTLTVAAEYAGQRYCEFKTALQGKIFVVYPLSAAKGMTEDGKFMIEVPRVQDGTFGSANIACAVAEDRYVKMRNVTSVLKFRIPGDAKPVKVVSVNAVDNAVAGSCTVDLSGGNPVVTATETSTDVLVKTDGLAGNFYASVIPGTYNAGFTMTAIALDLNNAVETESTVSVKKLRANDYFDLGRIGANLKALEGDGSKGTPWLIHNLPEMLAFTFYVNEGNSMKEQFVKVANDIKGVTTPVGSYDDVTKQFVAFQGDFDGGGKTVTVQLNQTGKNAVGLFAAVADSARIHDLTVAGSVKSDYHWMGGVAAFANCATTGVKFVNCTNAATITGGGNSGGILGRSAGNGEVVFEKCKNTGTISSDAWYAGGIGGSHVHFTAKECSNTGAVTAAVEAAGIVAHGYIGDVLSCTNAGNVTATEFAGNYGVFRNRKWHCDYRGGAGGMLAYSQNVTIKNCTNSGTITAVNKVGGMTGMTYWGSIINCKNTGAVTGTNDGDCEAGGIVGFAVTHLNLYGCENAGEVTAEKYQAGGIAGFVESWHPKNAASISVKRCTNSGKVTVKSGNAAGGIVGYSWVMNVLAKVVIDGCINKAEAEVKGPKFVGGILGAEGRYSNWSRQEILNCESHGRVLATITGEKALAYVGGIFGGPVNYTKNQGVMIWNCYNTGAVEYADATALYPNAGGIAGGIYHGTAGQVKNCYNSGKIRPAEGEPAANALLGAIVGYSAAAGVISECYYLEGSCGQGTGPGSKGAIANLAAASAEGTLATPASIGGSDHVHVVEALNAWRNGNAAFYSWTTGPNFVYPSYTDPVDSGGFDLGNGGEI